MTVLRNTKAPNMPISPGQFDKSYLDGFNNALRLYFNEVDNYTGALIEGNGGHYLSFPHIAASDNTDQYAGGNNTPTVVKWSTLESGSGFTLSPTGEATPDQTGVYKITYSLQFANTANQAHDVFVWLELDGSIQVPNSTTKFTIPARKSAGVPSYLVAYSEVVFTMITKDTVKLYWATEQAYNPVGPVDGVYIEYLPAQTSPFACPAAPSAIGSITFVSRPAP
jgi:hypothetical protein